MKFKWTLFLAMVLLFAPIPVNAQQESQMEKLDSISDDALKMVKFHRYEDAKKLLDYFTAQFTGFSGKEPFISMDELRIVNQSRDEAVEAAVSTDMKYEERMNKVTKFRLVIDAITTSEEPMWTAMKDQILTAFSQAKDAAEKGDSSQFNTSYNQFLSLYNVIYPSLKIDVPIERIQKLDTRITFIDENRAQIMSNSKSQDELGPLQSDLKSLFDSMKEDEADPSIWWVIISTGSIIIMTLSYVGYRKYKGEKEMKKDRSRDHKD